MSTAPISTIWRRAPAALQSPVRLHRDQRGTISIVSVFAVLLLTMLLGMLMNVGRQVDGKIRMQNAADAAAYSGGLVMTRGMNDLAFTNHLLADVFALTAFMREARDRHAQSYTDEILAAWKNVGAVFARSGFPKFDALGPAIIQKVPMEQRLVNTWSDWGAASSELILPLLEEILRQEMIPRYQRAVVEAFPDIAQEAAREIALRGGGLAGGQAEMLGVLWRGSGEPVGGESELTAPSLPVVDPAPPEGSGTCTCLCCGGASGGGAAALQPEYVATARAQRQQLAYGYLRQWNASAMVLFDRKAKMCQFGALWRSFTRGQLKQLLEEYPNTNLPHLIRTPRSQVVDANEHLEQDFTFLAVVYRRKLPDMMPRLFHDPMENDMLAYAAVRMFVPRSRLVWHSYRPGGSTETIPLGGVPGEILNFTPSDEPPPPDPEGGQRWMVGRQGVPTHWDLLNQHWTCQLVPAALRNLSTILQTPPPVSFSSGEGVVPPNLGSLTSEDLQQISPH
jgi:hypothetical protein